MNLQPLDLPGTDTGLPIVIAGPCSAETPEQVLSAARELKKDHRVSIFRAGVWKPRTKPGDFEGIGAPALEWLAQVKAETGLLTATEVAIPRHVREAVEAGIDLLWIGARTATNPFAMQEIADTLVEMKATDRPILVKNPMNADIELWVGALQRLNNAGVTRLGAIHRGFSVYGKHLYRNEPQWHIPIELRLRYPSLPIICDPSHIGGRREFILPLAQQALDMGFTGLIIESHCNPDRAWSDAAQQVTPEVLRYILDTLTARDHKVSTENLALLRRKIDEIDSQLMDLLARRMEVSRDIGRYKKEHSMPVVQPGRYNEVLASRIALGEEMGMGADFLRSILLAIHDESVRQQVDLQ